ncbi:UvrD-helicase domain-containing protein, partial [Treponema sp. R6D11]
NKGVPPAEDLDKEKLFFVGDEKQSIYMFRGADVSVFRKLKEEIKSEHLPLTTNYRSSSGLIGAFNAIFGGIYPNSGENAHPQKYNSVFA